MILDFNTDGSITGLTHEAFPIASLGKVVETKRYSHIWPKNTLLRVAFRALRLMFRDRGNIAQWSRSWQCVWTVCMAATPAKVEFASTSRAACIEWEKQHLLGE